MIEYKKLDEEEFEEVEEEKNEYDSLVSINHSIRDIEKGLYCAKKVKKVQFKYRVFKRKKYNYMELSSMISSDYAKAYLKLYSASTPRSIDKARSEIEILAYELSLINDETREYEYDTEIDNCISIFKADLRTLKRNRRDLILSIIKREFENVMMVKDLDNEDKENPSSIYKDRVLRRTLR